MDREVFFILLDICHKERIKHKFIITICTKHFILKIKSKFNAEKITVYIYLGYTLG